MQGRGEHSGGAVGLTDHTSPDLYGTAALLQLALVNAGLDQKILSGGREAKPPGSAVEDGTDSSILVGEGVRRFARGARS
jgi:hypothetical protein